MGVKNDEPLSQIYLRIYYASHNKWDYLYVREDHNVGSNRADVRWEGWPYLYFLKGVAVWLPQSHVRKIRNGRMLVRFLVPADAFSFQSLQLLASTETENLRCQIYLTEASGQSIYSNEVPVEIDVKQDWSQTRALPTELAQWNYFEANLKPEIVQ